MRFYIDPCNWSIGVTFTLFPAWGCASIGPLCFTWMHRKHLV